MTEQLHIMRTIGAMPPCYVKGSDTRSNIAFSQDQYTPGCCGKLWGREIVWQPIPSVVTVQHEETHHSVVAAVAARHLTDRDRRPECKRPIPLPGIIEKDTHSTAGVFVLIQ
jgi:hypothetical protein